MTLKTRIAAAGGVLAIALTLAACGTSGDAPGAATSENPTASAVATGRDVDTAHNEADTQFAQMMIVHHKGAIEMADLAVDRASTDEVRELAEGISAAQGPEIEQMTSWLEAWREETSMSGMDHGGHRGMDMDGMTQEEAMDELGSLSGEEFDRRFLELMTAHHEGAIEMAETELDEGENADALELAQKIIDDQKAEISEMSELAQNL